MPSSFHEDSVGAKLAEKVLDGGEQNNAINRVATESCCQISQFGSHYWELPSHDSQMDSDYSPLSNAPLGFDYEIYANFFLLLIGLL